MPSLPPWKISNYHPLITNHLAKQKKQKFYPNADMRTNIYSHISTHTHNPSFLPIPPPQLLPQMTPQHTRHTVSTIFLHQTTHDAPWVPPSSIRSLYPSSCTSTTCWHYVIHVFECVRNRSPHSIFNISSPHTPSYITITYMQYNINTT